MDIKDFLNKVDKDKLDEAMASDDPDALRKLAEEADMDLSDEQLDYIAGGWGSPGFDSEARDFFESFGIPLRG